jgi:peptidoglycan-N-acetylglucosamine deacetylase
MGQQRTAPWLPPAPVLLGRATDRCRPGVRHYGAGLAGAPAGNIVLCHDGGGNRSQTVRALGTVIPTLLQRGLTFVPLSVR